MSLMGNLLGFGAQQQTGGFLQNLKNIADLAQKYQQFTRNPIGSLLQMRPNVQIPQDITNSPQAVVQYLVNSGQMTQEQLKEFEQAAQQIQPLLPKF